MAQVWSVTCHVGSHSVACHPTQVKTPALTPARQGCARNSIDLPQRDGRLSSIDLGDLLCTEMVYPFAGSHPSKY